VRSHFVPTDTAARRFSRSWWMSRLAAGRLVAGRNSIGQEVLVPARKSSCLFTVEERRRGVCNRGAGPATTAPITSQTTSSGGPVCIWSGSQRCAESGIPLLLVPEPAVQRGQNRGELAGVGRRSQCPRPVRWAASSTRCSAWSQASAWPASAGVSSVSPWLGWLQGDRAAIQVEHQHRGVGGVQVVAEESAGGRRDGRAGFSRAWACSAA